MEPVFCPGCAQPITLRTLLLETRDELEKNIAGNQAEIMTEGVSQDDVTDCKLAIEIAEARIRFIDAYLPTISEWK